MVCLSQQPVQMETPNAYGYAAVNADNGYTSLTGPGGNPSFTYDGNGNMTFDGFNTLTYDVENRLVEAQNGAWGTSTYRYDPLGQRKQKQVTSGAWVTTTQFVLAGNEEIADYNGVGGPLSLTVRGAGGLPVASITPSSSSAATVAAYYHHDVMGSTVAATVPGVSGAAVVFTYSDFGVPGAGSGLAYTYAGYRYDTETGLYYVNARYYNPNLGRFLQTDPIGLSGGTNLYAYVGNDPINLIDPSGHCAQWPSQSPDMSIFGNSHPNVVPDPTVPWSIAPVGNPQVYTSQNPLTAGPYQFAGTVYTYQVVNAAGAPITDPMVVNETFSNITLNPNTQAPVASGWNLPQSGGGTFSDYVGFKTGPSPLASSFTAYAGQGSTVTQNFTVATDAAVTTLTTVNTLQTSVDSNGNVTGTATNVVHY